jgi:hypothetical protein
MKRYRDYVDERAQMNGDGWTRSQVVSTPVSAMLAMEKHTDAMALKIEELEGALEALDPDTY